MKYIDAEKLAKNLRDIAASIEKRLHNIVEPQDKSSIDEEQLPQIILKNRVDKSFFNGELSFYDDVLTLIDSLQQEQGLIVINKKDWEAQEQFRKNKDFGKPLQQEQPSVPDNLKLNMTRTKLELNEIETLTHLVRAKAVEPGHFQGLYKGILSKLNKMFDEKYAERKKGGTNRSC